MRISGYQRQAVEPDSAGGVLRTGAGAAEFGVARALNVVQGQIDQTSVVLDQRAAAEAELAERKRRATQASKIDRSTVAYKLGFTSWLDERSRDPTQHETLERDFDQVRHKLREQALKPLGGDPEAQAALAMRLDEFDGFKAIEVRRVATEQAIGIARATLADNLNGQAALYARSNGYEKEAVLADALSAIGAQVHAGSINAEQAQRLHQGFIDTAFGDEISRRIETDPAQLLEDLQGGRYAGATERVLVQGERATRDELKRLRAEDERRSAKLEAARNAQRHDAERAIDRVGRILDAGVAVDPTILATARTMAAGTGLEADLNAMLVGYQDRAKFAASPVADQRATLKALQTRATTEGADENDVRELRARERIYAAALKDVKTDALQAAVDRGLVGDLPPVDISSPGALAESLQGRTAAAGIASQFAGRPVSPLTKGETAAFGELLNTSTTAERQSLLHGLKRGLSDEQFTATLAQLSPDSPLPAYAAAIGLQTPGTALFSPGSPSMLVLDGDVLLRPPKGEKPFPMPAENFRRDEFNTVTGGAFDSAPAAYRQVRLAADAAYASLSARAGDFSGEIDADRYREAVQTVSGGVVKINGKRLVKPFSMTEDTFRDVLDQTTAATVQHLGGVAEYTNDEAAEAIRDGELVNYGDGYAVRDGGRLLMRADGRGVFVWRPAAAVMSRFMRQQ